MLIGCEWNDLCASIEHDAANPFFADCVCKFQTPEIQESLIHKHEAAFAVEDIGEVRYGRKGDVQNAGLPVEEEEEIVGFSF